MKTEVSNAQILELLRQTIQELKALQLGGKRNSPPSTSCPHCSTQEHRGCASTKPERTQPTPTPSPNAPNSRPAPSNNDDEPREGRRVQITIRDQYYKRLGILLNQKGNTYWWIQLDQKPHEIKPTTIYKKATSFRVLSFTQYPRVNT